MEAFKHSGAPLTDAEMIKNASIIDEGRKLCPLCRSAEVKLFFINLNEKVLMCENVDCVYPFGYEEVIYVKVNNERACSEELASIRSKPTFGSTPTCSEISAAAWSDIAKINSVNETEGIEVSDNREYYKHKDVIKTPNACKKKLDNCEKILEKVEAIKKIQVQISEEEGENCLRNIKWIGNLMSKQEASGKVLLKPEEVNFFKNSRLEIGLGELQIDINRGSGEGSLIKIDIANKKPDKKNNSP